MRRNTLILSSLAIPVLLGLMVLPPLQASAATYSIDLIACDDGGVAKWKGSDNIVTYKIDNVAGLKSSVVDAVRAGIQEWNTVQDVYNLQEVQGTDADITVSLYYKVTPGYVLGYAIVDCASASDGISGATIVLGVKGLSNTGVKNLAAHEMGHGLGDGHANVKGDLMYASFDSKERRTLYCPSDLDVGGLSATTSPHESSTWERLTC